MTQKKVLSKNEKKEAQKKLEDKTFGMKNKKGKAAQKKISTFESTLGLKQEYKSQRKDIDETMDYINKVAADEFSFKPPSKMLCVAFKLGKCNKGSKCKFSHDPSLLPKPKEESESEEEKDEETKKTSENNTEKLKNRNYTKIICKHFIEACEKRHYGAFWKCPNGLRCIYVHRLPEGYVLERDKKLMKEQQKEMELNEITVEEFIEEELEKIQGQGGPLITEEIFKKWKLEKNEAEAKLEEKDSAAKKEQLGKGKTDKLTGKELYELQANKDALLSTDNQDNSAQGDVFTVNKDDIIGEEEVLEDGA